MINVINSNKERIKLNSLEEIDSIEKNVWIHLEKPSLIEIDRVCDLTQLDEKRLMEAIDPEEIAHVDFDDDNLITIDIPVWNGRVFETQPFVIMYNNDYFVTISNTETDLVDQLLLKTKIIDAKKKNRLSMLIMYRATAMYITALKRVDKDRHALEDKIKTSTKNKEIFELMNINKSLIYISTSLNSNKMAYYKLDKIAEFKKYEEDNDLMDDVILENNQASEMCSIYREIIDGMMNAFASITSNNLNIIMRLLAIITLVISLPTLISSIYGMNVDGLPFAHTNGAFWIILAFSACVGIIGAIVLVYFTNRSIRQKKQLEDKQK